MRLVNFWQSYCKSRAKQNKKLIFYFFAETQRNFAAGNVTASREQNKINNLFFIFGADCKSEPSKTVESIFSSNIETINTLGNILFAEKVSEFYLNRQQLYTVLKEASQEAFNEEDGITTSIENLKRYNLSNLIFLCESFTSKLKEINEQCKQMMNVTDAEIAAFQSERLKLDTQFNKAKEEEFIQKMIDRNQRFQQAIESSK